MLTCEEVCVDVIRPADGHVAVVLPLHTHAYLSEAGRSASEAFIDNSIFYQLDSIPLSGGVH